MIKMIFAHGPVGEFGTEDRLPWDCPADLQHFKEYTKDCILVMGSATFASLPRKLPGRLHLVIGREGTTAKNGDAYDYHLNDYKDIQDILEIIDSHTERDLCVIGGRSLLRLASTFVSEASITSVSTSGDANYFIDHKGIYDNLYERFPNSSCKHLGSGVVVQEWR